MQDLFADVILSPQIKLTFYPHQRKCLYCFCWFETTSQYAKKCFEHINLPDRKLLQRTYGLNEMPFKNFNRITRKYE